MKNIFFQHHKQIAFFEMPIAKQRENENIVCEGSQGEYECKYSLDQIGSNKSPGSDGLTGKFYKTFWDKIKTYYLNSINHPFQTGHLIQLQKQNVLTIIPKSGNTLELLTNWRPLSLLNMIIKSPLKL